MAKKNNNENYNATIRVTTLTKTMISVGIIGLIISGAINDDLIKSYPILLYVKNILEPIVSALFSAGLVSVIVEISTIKNLVSDAFNQILTCNFPLDNFNENTLHSLNQEVASKLIGIPEKKIENTIYRYENNLIDAVKEKYYEYHNMTYHITPDSKNNCFNIKANMACKIVNKSLQDNIFLLGLKLYKPNENMSQEQCLKSLNISNFKINKKEIPIDQDLISIEDVVHERESRYYDYKIKLVKDLGNVPTNNIKLEFTYSVPISDICQSFKMRFPCKQLEHKIYIKKDVSTEEAWTIRSNAYSTFYHRQDDDESNYKVDQNIDEAITITFNKWAFAGNGYCVFYQKK
ncbi:MAG: hypothetical protein ACLRZ9_08990 [Eubacterium sp.]